MIVFYTQKDLVGFGSYLLSEERENSLQYADTKLPLEDRRKVVTDADLANFITGTKEEIKTES